VGGSGANQAKQNSLPEIESSGDDSIDLNGWQEYASLAFQLPFCQQARSTWFNTDGHFLCA
jgi:hypothetical protein